MVHCSEVKPGDGTESRAHIMYHLNVLMSCASVCAFVCVCEIIGMCNEELLGSSPRLPLFVNTTLALQVHHHTPHCSVRSISSRVNQRRGKAFISPHTREDRHGYRVHALGGWILLSCQA